MQSQKFKDVNLVGSDFRDMGIVDVDFENCLMDETEFTGSTLENCHFKKCELSKVDFSSCSMSNCSFDGCNLANADFSNSGKIIKMSWTKFSNCKMTGANFLNLKSGKVTFENCILRLAYFYGFNFKKQKLSGLDLAEADICDCIFDEAIFENSSLRNAGFKGVVSFHNTDLRGCDIGGLKAEKIIGAFVSKSQATELLGKMNIKVI